MQIDPVVQAVFVGLAAAEAPPPADLAARREQSNATMLLLAAPEPGTVVSDNELTVDGGTVRIRVRRPGGTAVLPAVYFVHGGGWVQGDLDTGEVECGPLASQVGCVVVSVEYRLAPEHPFPTPLEDVVAGWEWLFAHAEEHGIDTARVAVAGTSAGGNLAAALCLVARERGLPMPVLQLLDVPALDLTGGSPSLSEVGDAAGLTATQVKEFARCYAGDTGLAHPHVSPLLAEDLSGLAPAVVVVAEHDPVRDDGERWVGALQNAGVAAAGVRVLTHLHGSWILPGTLTSDLVRDLRVSALRHAFSDA
jgi:acetyl esterase